MILEICYRSFKRRFSGPPGLSRRVELAARHLELAARLVQHAVRLIRDGLKLGQRRFELADALSSSLDLFLEPAGSLLGLGFGRTQRSYQGGVPIEFRAQHARRGFLRGSHMVKLVHFGAVLVQ